MSKKRASRSSQPTTSRKLSSTKDRLLHKRNDRPSKDHRPSPAQRRSSTFISEPLSTLNSRSTVPGALTQLLDGRRSTLELPSARKRRREETESGEVGQAVSTLSHIPGPTGSSLRRSTRIPRRPKLPKTTPASSVIPVATASQEKPEHPFITNMQIHKPGRGPRRTKFFRGKLDTQSPVNLISVKKVEELGLLRHVQPISDMSPITLRTIGEGPGSLITPISSVMITWHTNGKDHVTYTKEFHVLPPTLPEPAFDCLIGWETIQQEKFLHRNEEICYLEIVRWKD